MLFNDAKKTSIMSNTSTIPPLQQNATLLQAIDLFLRYHTDLCIVVDHDNLILGVVTKNILLCAMRDHVSLDQSVSEFMRTRVVTMNQYSDALDIREQIIDRGVASAVIVDDDSRYIGIATRANLLRGLRSFYEAYAADLQAIFNANQNGLIKISNHGDIIMLNAVACEILGVTYSEVVDRPASDFLPALVYDHWHKLSINGKSIFLKYAPTQYSDFPPETLAVLYDSTDLDQISAELKSAKELKESLLTILDIVYDGIVISNQNDQITFCNRPCAEFFGSNTQALLGKSTDDFFKLPRRVSDVPATQATTIRGKSCLVMHYGLPDQHGNLYKIVFKELPMIRRSIPLIDTMEKELSFYKNRLTTTNHHQFGVDNIVGSSMAMRHLKDQINLIARSQTTILLLGESGTGKEVLASAIYEESRQKGNFVKVNCAAVPENLLESEFFGYADGAFTGAKKGGKIGKFQLANKGTLFLDEIGDMDPMLQAKLLRVLQDREFEPVGSNTPITVDVRIIAATNKDLERMVLEGKFRQDLYYRLNIIPLVIPPLRERRDDIIPLAEYLIEKFNNQLGAAVSSISPDGMDLLTNYDWPGNVRELGNILERIISLNAVDVITSEMILPHLKPTALSLAIEADAISTEHNNALGTTHQAKERYDILAALSKVRGNRSKAALLLGISRTTLYVKLAKYGIE